MHAAYDTNSLLFIATHTVILPELKILEPATPGERRFGSILVCHMDDQCKYSADP